MEVDILAAGKTILGFSLHFHVCCREDASFETKRLSGSAYVIFCLGCSRHQQQNSAFSDFWLPLGPHGEELHEVRALAGRECWARHSQSAFSWRFSRPCLSNGQLDSVQTVDLL